MILFSCHGDVPEKVQHSQTQIKPSHSFFCFAFGFFCFLNLFVPLLSCLAKLRHESPAEVTTDLVS